MSAVLFSQAYHSINQKMHSYNYRICGKTLFKITPVSLRQSWEGYAAFPTEIDLMTYGTNERGVRYSLPVDDLHGPNRQEKMKTV